MMAPVYWSGSDNALLSPLHCCASLTWILQCFCGVRFQVESLLSTLICCVALSRYSIHKKGHYIPCILFLCDFLLRNNMTKYHDIINIITLLHSTSWSSTFTLELVKFFLRFDSDAVFSFSFLAFCQLPLNESFYYFLCLHMVFKPHTLLRLFVGIYIC